MCQLLLLSKIVPAVIAGQVILVHILDAEAGLLEVCLVGHVLLPLPVGVHPGEVEGGHLVIVVLQLDLLAVLVQDLDVQAQALQLLDQDLEGLGHAGLARCGP